MTVDLYTLAVKALLLFTSFLVSSNLLTGYLTNFNRLLSLVAN